MNRSRAASTDEIPVIDLAPAFGGDPESRQVVVEQIDHACRDVGFFVVVGHGIDLQLLEGLRRIGHSFFELSDQQKLAYGAAPGTDFAGYLRSEALSYSRGDAAPPDLKETFSIHPPSRPGRHRATPWPSEVTDFETVATAYFAAMEDLAARVMRLFASALDLPELFFDPYIDQSLSALRLLHYPELDEPPLAGQLRAGAHTDFGSLTLLLTDDAAGGLQVRRAGGSWIDVPHIPGAFVVNIGDLMAQWTNDRWISTLHRVVVPPVGPGTRRLSAAFFHQPNDDALIETLSTCRVDGEPDRYEPVLSGEHLRRKIRLQREMVTQ